MSSTEHSFEKIKLILSDVDGVLTDGGISFDNNGIESKKIPHQGWSGHQNVATSRISIWNSHGKNITLSKFVARN